MTHFITAPLVNVNDDTMVLIEWTKAAGTLVKKGEVIGVLETSKSSYEIQSDGAGYLTTFVDAGSDVTVGQTIGALAETADAVVSLPQAAAVATVDDAQAERNWTKKAEILAGKHNLDIAAIGRERAGSMVNEADIEAIVAARKGAPSISVADATDIADEVFPTNRQQRILLLGGGMGATLVLDVLTRVPNQRAVGILDDNPKIQGKTVMGVPVIGRMDDIVSLWERKAFDGAVIAISTLLKLRNDLFNKFTALGIPFANVIDPTVAVSSNVSIGTGNVIFGFCRIGTCTTIGDNNFISAYVNIEHHNTLGDCCTFGPGLWTSGDVKLGSRIRFGTGIFVEPHIVIGDDSIVASGTVLTANVPPKSIVKTKANFSIQPL